MTDLTKVMMHTDGSCIGNPGPGGWGTILSCKGVDREISGGERHTTNNRMEMQAVIEGLSALKVKCAVTVVSDSKYIIDNIRGVNVWRGRGWRTTAGKPVKNKDLWETLDELCQNQQVTFQWVKGHAGHPGNERADKLALQAAKEFSGN
jgi:ribonuclease HI